MPRWVWIIPLLAACALGVGLVLPPHPLAATLLFAALLGAVIAGVHHAEVVAHRVGEPFGTLVLALAITVIGGTFSIPQLLFAGAGSLALYGMFVFVPPDAPTCCKARCIW